MAEKKALLKMDKFKEGVKATEIVNWLKGEFELDHGHATAIYVYIKGKRK